MDFQGALLLLIGGAAAIHLVLRRTSLTRETVLEIVLLWMLGIGIGINGLYAFIGHTFFADQVAAAIGWPAGNPFQLEVGLANLGFGVCGLFCLKFRNGFWLATILASGIFLVGAGIGHLYQSSVHQNFAPLNTGMIVIYDILFPVLLLVLYGMLTLSRR
jgi:hypothetical protein